MQTSIAIVLVAFLSVSVSAADLYKISITDQGQANLLRSSIVDPVLRLGDAYLVIADPSEATSLATAGLQTDLLSPNVNREHLKLVHMRPGQNEPEVPVVYTEKQLRICVTDQQSDRFINVGNRHAVVGDHSAARRQATAAVPASSLSDSLIALRDSLVNLVSQDSLRSYLETLVNFGWRRVGMPGNSAGGEWLKAKLESFGYEVEVDYFVGEVHDTIYPCYNLTVRKTGTQLPEQEIVIGAHRDSWGGPGADDDGTGTVAVLEMARIFADVDLPVTLVFALFDAEELWMVGSYHWLGRALQRHEDILWMMNLDMCGHKDNTDTAYSYFIGDPTYAQLWSQQADALVNIAGPVTLYGWYGDSTPFHEAGIPWVWPFEYRFSTVYHSPQDNTNFISYQYLTRMIKASLGTIFVGALSPSLDSRVALAFDEHQPNSIRPGRTTDVTIAVQASNIAAIDPSSATLNYEINGTPGSTPLSQVTDSQYTGTLPIADCGDSVTYSIAIMDAVTAQTHIYPGPAYPFSVVVASDMNMLFVDSFETDKGWTVSGDAKSGHWERAIPNGDGLMGAPPGDFDRSGWCFVTGNSPTGNDVDSGKTWLISPTLKLGSGNYRLVFDAWFSNGRLHEDYFSVAVSTDNGASWRSLYSSNPSVAASGGWYEYSFNLSDIMPLTVAVKIRFQAEDFGQDSQVEAAIDHVRVIPYSCVPPCCFGTTGDIYPDGIVDLRDLSWLIAYLLHHEGADIICTDAANIDSVGIINLPDLSLLVAYLTVPEPNRPGLPFCP